MKHLFFFFLVFSCCLSGCKKEYRCCYLDENGNKVSFIFAGCETAKMSKKEKDELESKMKAEASDLGWSAECK